MESYGYRALALLYNRYKSMRATVLLNSEYSEFLPLSPPGWRGIVVTIRAGGRVVGRAAARLAEPISL